MTQGWGGSSIGMSAVNIFFRRRRQATAFQSPLVVGTQDLQATIFCANAILLADAIIMIP